MAVQKNKRLLITVTLLLIAVVMVIGSLTTCKAPREIDKGKTGGRDFNLTPLTEELKAEIKAWQASGFIRKIMTGSHEFWVDPEIWKGLCPEEKDTRVRKFSKYLKSFDGTNQVVVKAHGTDEWLAEFFANTMRTK